jgi:hypothetical protein
MELVTRTTAIQHLHGAPVTRIPRKTDLRPTFPKGRIALTCIFFGSLAGIALCWWLG